MESTLIDLKNRRAVRSFKDEAVCRCDLEKIMEAATYAPTGMNRQHPIIVVVENRELIKKLSAMNAAVLPGRGGDPFYGAPCVAIVFADPTVSHTAVEDGSLVLGNMMNAAYAIGVGSCWIHRAREMFESDEGKALMAQWNIPDTYVGVGNCILGYPAGEHPEAKPRKQDYVRYVG